MRKAGKALIIVFFPALIVASQPEITQARWMIHQTEFVSIWYKGEDGLETLFKRLYSNSIGRGVRALLGGGEYSEEKLNEEINGLLHRVGALLGMDAEGVAVKIKVYKDKHSMNAEVLPFWKGKKPTAFYVPARKTIYVSLDTVNANIMAHEFTHALLHYHFGKPVPMLTQEILSQYIDLNM